MAQKHQKRWFIWTLVFLVVAGVSLVSYIMLTDYTSNADDGGGWIVHQTQTNKAHK